jgi:hypothetical protein
LPNTVSVLFNRLGGRLRTMREESSSSGFLSVTVTGVFLLCSGLVAFAFY